MNGTIWVVEELCGNGWQAIDQEASRALARHSMNFLKSGPGMHRVKLRIRQYQRVEPRRKGKR